MHQQNRVTSWFLIGSCSLAGTALILDANRAWQQDGPLPPFLLHLLATISFLALFFVVRMRHSRHQALEAAAHVNDLISLQREIDGSVLRYKSLLDDAGDAILVINPASGNIEELNRRGAELFGYPATDLPTLTSSDLIADTERRKFSSFVRRVRSRGMASADGIFFQRQDKSRFLGEMKARLVNLGDGMVLHAIIRDITIRNKVEHEIRQRNRELSILNNIIALAHQDLNLQSVLDVTLRETLEVFRANGGAIHLLERDEKRLSLATRLNLGTTFNGREMTCGMDEGLYCRIAARKRHLVIADLATDKSPLAREAIADGWHSFAGIPLFAQNNFIGVMFVVTLEERHFSSEDMKIFMSIGNQMGMVIEHARLFAELNWKTEELMRSYRLLEKNSHKLAVSEKRLKKNLALVEQANAELARLDRMKTHFLGMISHEFKTPLTSILSGAEFLLSGNSLTIDAEGQHVLSMIQQGGARLNVIITDLLKVVRLEAKKPSIDKITLSLADICTEVIEQFLPLCQERNLSITVSDLSAIPRFNGDKEYLEEVFGRLLENSLKFTPNGGSIAILAEVVDSSILAPKKELLANFNPLFYDTMMSTCYLQVEIRDNGIGIDADDQTNIFSTFYEVGDISHHSSGRNKFQGKGAGLGLAIVKGMIEAHGGMVWVESPGMIAEANPGSSFFILLPMEETTRQSVFPFMDGEVQNAEPENFTEQQLGIF